MTRPVARPSRAATLREWVPPQLSQLVEAAPEGDQWLHEIKFDGYRMHARLDRGAVKLLTRTGPDCCARSSMRDCAKTSRRPKFGVRCRIRNRPRRPTQPLREDRATKIF